MSQSHQTQDGKKWWEIDDPPVKPSVQPSVAPSEPPSEQPKAPARRWEAARKTYGKGDPDVVLSAEGNRFDRLKGKSKGDKGDSEKPRRSTKRNIGLVRSVKLQRSFQ
jgi:hypothetical protein